jgi:aminoglycoside phosphotransferase family enzyme
LHYLERHAEEFDARVNAGRIVEGHGDLRPEHIYLGSPPLVIDCLEFNRALRLLDPLEELATLALECERSGAGWVGRFVHGVYSRECRDIASPSLLAFHTAARGLLRAKLCAWHLRDAAVTEHGRWLASTRQYLTLAERHAARCASPGSGQ